MMARAMAADPSVSLPNQHDGSWAGLKGAYRLLSNPAVDPHAMQQPHRDLTWQSCQKASVVLVAQDDTELDFSRRAARGSVSGMGRLSGPGLGRGLYQHTALAVDASSRRVLGIVDQRWWVRAITPRHRETRRERQARQTEADRWEQVARTLAERHEPWEKTRLIHVGDRGSDVWRFMQACGELDHGFVLRAQHDRAVMMIDSRSPSVAPKRLWATLQMQPPQAGLRLELTRQRKSEGTVTREPRTARVLLRVQTVTLPPPRNDPRTTHAAPLKVTAIHVHEEDLPKGIKPAQRIDWMLLTSEPVHDVAEALRLIGYYQQRWLIEEFHRCLKQGCRLEASRLDQVADIQRLAALHSVIAMRLIQMRDAARDPTIADDPAALLHLATPAQRQVVALWTGRGAETLTPKQFYLAIAKRGGHLGRTRDGPPGWITLHRGMRDLLIAADILARARPPNCG